MICIQVTDLIKEYVLPTSKARTFKEFILKDLFRGGGSRTIRALKGISFSVESGKTLGIIGGNGSGKSTLLRLLAGITEPDSGGIRIQGRIATILDLGVGFHPELDGIENIYLQGAVVGIPRKDLDTLLDRIIEFAELRSFIHMPLKYYSTGMKLRLGFSIAINVNPDILLIDEVIAVGDVGFQKKSFNLIKELKRHGTTIILVTHNMEQAELICDEIIWLDNGEIRDRGDAEIVVNAYVQHAHRLHIRMPIQPFHFEQTVISDMGRYGSGEITIEDVVIRRRDGTPTRRIDTEEQFSIELEYLCRTPHSPIDCQIGIYRLDGANICCCCSEKYDAVFYPETSRGRIIATFDPMVLEPGKYLLSVSLCPPDKPLEPYDMQLRMYNFTVESQGYDIDAPRPAVRLPAAFTSVNHST